MNDQLLAQLLGSPQAAANAPVSAPDMDYEQMLKTMTPAARLETLKFRKRQGKLDKTGEAILGLLAQRVQREQALSTPGNGGAAPSVPMTEDTLLQRLQGLDPLAPLRTQQYQ